MPTIRAMTQQSSMLYKISSKGLNVNALSNRKGLATGVPNAYQANRNDYNYIKSFFGGTDSFRNLMSDYSSTKKQFTNGYNATMNRLGKAADKLKNASQNAGSTMAKAAENTKSAVYSLQSYAGRQTGLDGKEKQGVGSALTTLANFAEGYSGASDKVKKNAQNAVKTVQNFLEQRTGVTEKDIDKADKALDNLRKLAEEPDDAARDAEKGQESVSALRSFLNNYAGAGEPVLENAEAAVRFLQRVAGRAEGASASLNVLQAFAQNHTGTDDETRAALGTVQTYVRSSFPGDQETAKAAQDALSDIEKLIGNRRAGMTSGEETPGQALSSLEAVHALLARYDSATARAAEAKEMKDALDTIQNSVGQARSAFAPLQTVRDFTDEDGAARVRAKEENEEIVSAVQEFANAHNAATKFLQNNRDLSGRLSSLAGSFSDMRGQERALGAAGITASSDGTLSVDTARLTKALEEKPDAVRQTLGESGLAGRAERNVSLAGRQEDRLFPTVSSMMGVAATDSSKAMYSDRAVAAQMNYNNVGTLLNLYF
ncbi:MAG: flagellar filament capping protein FliD [Schwartzia sp.]|nr:flagellar filament capping protein FliD [Schwartzia sp. (in: firmicutes)]